MNMNIKRLVRRITINHCNNKNIYNNNAIHLNVLNRRPFSVYQSTDRPHVLGITVTSKGGWHSQCDIFASEGHQIRCDEPKLLGGEGSGPTSMEVFLGSVCASIQNTIYVHSRQMEPRFDYQRVNVKATTELNSARFKGLKESVPSCGCPFEKIDIQVAISTYESIDRIKELQSKVEAACPLVCLMQSAGVSYEAQWNRQMVAYD